MRIRIDHATTYVYDRAARFIIQTLRLSPRSSEAQQVRNWRVETDVDARSEPILAIVMSMHRPVIGWSYGRPALVPAAVSAAYLVTVLAILLDVKRVARSPSAAFA